MAIRYPAWILIRENAPIYLIRLLITEKSGDVITCRELQQAAAIGDGHLRLHDRKLHLVDDLSDMNQRFPAAVNRGVQVES